MCEIHVYTLRYKSWRRLEDIPYDLRNHFSLSKVARVPVNGALHWIAFRVSVGKKTEVILSLNMEKEIFKEIQMPNFLKDYEVKDSWTRLFTIDIQNFFGNVAGSIPLRSFENGEILFGKCMNDTFNVVLYDPEHEPSRTLQVYDGVKMFSYCLFDYKESLVSPNSATYLRPDEEDDSEQFLEKEGGYGPLME
ncbi:uncharacterized protein LOC113339510 [Papaver somniferum]|uniref:uncharacterized protein LOC113339510 n=1 Tax=Papaver somniferum TaxID=3469 RepID=UPI000E6F6866|nr:uncharacterized protein LOC113339510 [Papaver somniferum]